MLLRVILLLSFALPTWATVFQIQSVDQQIQESDGIIIGNYLHSKTIKLENGTIATQMIFRMSKEIGMQSELFGMDEIIVHYPGGVIGDEHVVVEGVPRFVAGENVVIMIRNDQERFWGMNLGFGSFKVINYGHEKMIVNTIFPNDRTAGQMRMEDFEKAIINKKKTGLKTVTTTSYTTNSNRILTTRRPASLEEGKERAVASISEEEENIKSQTELTTVWLILFLAILGGTFRLIRQKDIK